MSQIFETDTIEHNVMAEIGTWKETELMHTLDALIELEIKARRPIAFKRIRAAMANDLQRRIGVEAFAGMYDASVLVAE